MEYRKNNNNQKCVIKNSCQIIVVIAELLSGSKSMLTCMRLHIFKLSFQYVWECKQMKQTNWLKHTCTNSVDKQKHQHQYHEITIFKCRNFTAKYRWMLPNFGNPGTQIVSHAHMLLLANAMQCIHDWRRLQFRCCFCLNWLILVALIINVGYQQHNS